MIQSFKHLILVLLFVGAITPLLAYDHIVYDESYWPKSYFVSAAFGGVFTRGDVNERAITITDSADVRYKAHSAEMSFFGTPDLSIGANIRCFSLLLDFQYWKSEEDLVDTDVSEDTQIWRVGFEFTYNLFWPNEFQVGLGLGLSYTNLTSENSVFLEDKTQDSQLMGSGLGFIANVHYYFTDNLAIVPAIKIYENWYRFVNSKASGTCDLDPYLWQTYIMASIGLQFQF